MADKKKITGTADRLSQEDTVAVAGDKTFSLLDFLIYTLTLGIKAKNTACSPSLHLFRLLCSGRVIMAVLSSDNTT